MKVLLDEMLPIGVADLLPEHEVTTVRDAGYTGLKNGDLIRRATAAGFAILVTADRNIPAQQNIAASRIAVVLIPGNRLADIAPQADAIRRAVRNAGPGTVTRVGQTG